MSYKSFLKGKSHFLGCTFEHHCIIRHSLLRTRLSIQNGQSLNFMGVARMSMSTASKKSTNSNVVKSSTGEVQKDLKQKWNFRPFLKELFIGEFDHNALIYPEMEIEDVQRMENLTKRATMQFSNSTKSLVAMDSKDKGGEIPLHVLKEMKFLSLSIPQEFGGDNFQAQKISRISELLASHDMSSAVLHQDNQLLAIQPILLYGTDEQKMKYLPKIASGETLAAFCYLESSSGSDGAAMQCSAEKTSDGAFWNLYGTKTHVVNGREAQLLVVFAKSPVTNSDGETKHRTSAFIVEKSDCETINFEDCQEHLGLNGLKAVTVHFNNTKIPIENMVGDAGEGYSIAQRVLNSSRYPAGSIGAAVLKKLVKMTVNERRATKRFGSLLLHCGMIQEKLSAVALDTYAMESMSYMCAGMMDSGDYVDCDMENAATKVFATEMCLKGVESLFAVLGEKAARCGVESTLRDVVAWQRYESTNDVLRLFIALSGLRYAGDYHKKFLENAPYLWVSHPRMMTHYTQAFLKARVRDKVASSLPHWTASAKRRGGSSKSLEKHTHPQLELSAKMLNATLDDFGHACKMLLTRYKQDVVNQQMLLSRVADIAIKLYAMTAVIGRASRAKCIGLRNCDHDILLASTFTYQSHMECSRLLQDLDMAVIGDTLFRKHSRIARETIEEGEFVAEHPLTKVF